MKAVMITWSSSPVYQCRKYGMLVGWVVVRARVKLEVGVGRFMVHLMAKRAIGAPVIMTRKGRLSSP
jgi:hypothetical protein